MINTTNSKELLRKLVQAKRKSLDKKIMHTHSKTIIDSLIKNEVYKSSKTVFTYVPFQNEVDTSRILTSKKEIIVPKIIQGKIKLSMYDKNNLRLNKLGILEPKKIIPPKNTVDVVLVPGIVFDKQFNRIGFGRGFYDFVLKDLTAVKIGLCYHFQLKNLIPSQDHDIKMDYIITEKRILKRKNI